VTAQNGVAVVADAVGIVVGLHAVDVDWEGCGMAGLQSGHRLRSGTVHRGIATSKEFDPVTVHR